IAVMGPSGSGKTTFLNHVGMLDVPTSGEIYLERKDVTKMNGDERAEYRLKHLGFVFQFFNLFNELTALENVMFPMMLNKQSGYKERARELLEHVGLGDRLHHLPSEISGGQQQRVTIARALANNPTILLADEPTGNLDSKSSKEIIELFRKLNLENGQTIVMVTHSQEIGEMADKILYFRDGIIEKVVQNH
ncbi:MAG TPA: ABC transporter ATP-binding protein, partial [Candidatus Methanoperedens sp.]